MYNQIDKTNIIFSNFSMQCEPRECFSEELSPNKWQTISYKTAKVSGTMIRAGMTVNPPPLILSPGLTGWHRIYVCMFAGVKGRTYISLRLSDDRAPAFISIGDMNTGYWSNKEQCEESFWKCVDMTGQSLTISKSPSEFQSEATLMWLRFVPMTDDEINAELSDRARKDVKRLHAHSDMEWQTFTAPKTLDEYSAMIEEYSFADIELASVEMSIKRKPNFQNPPDDLELRSEWERCKWLVMKTLHERRDDVYSDILHRAHRYGIKLLAAQRCGISPDLVDSDFIKSNSQFYCRDRDNEEIAFMSYTYQTVQNYIIDSYLQKVALGFDGASLIFTRGIFILFEQPVLDEFAIRFGMNLDPKTLPLWDERLVEVRCSIMTSFMRRLRTALDKFAAESGRERLIINPFVCYSAFDSKLLGLDVETWAREGLIDCVVVSNMMTFEVLDGMWNDKAPSLIDIEKYKRGKYENLYSPIQRIAGNRLDKMFENCPEWMRIAKSYDIKVYFELPWENTTAPEALRDYAETLYNRGAENLSLWDCYINRVQYRPEWQITSKLGHKDELKLMSRKNSGYRSLHRILSLNNRSLASYNPEWYG